MDPHAPALLAALAAAAVPHRALRCDAEVLGGPALLLVRPDGHVGWRGAGDPADAGAIVARLAGR
jgi:hypothetical protein